MAERFDPVWMYGPGLNSLLCTTRDEYAGLVEQGWQDTPAAFGVETHPAKPFQTVSVPVEAQVQASPAAPMLSPDTVSRLEQQVAALGAQVQTLSLALDTAQRGLLSLADRVHELEGAINAPSPTEDPETPSPGRRK